MKKFLLCFLFIIPIIFANAQDLDYSFIRSDGQYHYTEYEPTDSFRNLLTQDYQEILVTDSGKFFKSYPYAFERFDDGEFEYIDANTSPLGDSIFVDNEGNTTIFTANDKVFYFKRPLGDWESWIIYVDDHGNYLKGRNSPITYSNFYPYLPNVTDSVVKCNIYVYDSTDSQISSNLKTDILISKKYGADKILPFNKINYLTEDYPIYTTVGIERDSFNDGFSLKDSYEDVYLSLEIGNEVHVKYEDYNDGLFHYEIRKVIGKEVGDSLVHYTFQYCDSLSTDSIITSEVDKSYYYKMRNRELVDSGLFTNKTFYQDVIDFYNYDWHGKKYFRFYSRESDHMEFYQNRNYWTFYYPDQISNYGTAYYEFIEDIGVIVVDKWDGNYLLDEIHYYKTATEEWGTPFTHYCPNNTGISETASSQIKIYPNPAEDVLFIESPLEIDLVKIFDIQGRLIKSIETLGQKMINISDLESGIYILELEQKQGRVINKKLKIK